MPVTQESTLVSFDANRVLAAVQEVATGPVYSFIEFTPESYTPLFVADDTLAFYEDDDHVRAHFDRIHSYAEIDFTEIELFVDELFPIAERVEYLVTALDYLKLIRIFIDHEGLFIAVGPDEPVTPITDAVRETLEELGVS